MYLARHVGRWSTTVIGRFYNGRDHSTVCYGIQRIEALRESDPDVDALITDLKHELRTSADSPAEKLDKQSHGSVRLSHCDLQILADLIAERVYARIEKRVAESAIDEQHTLQRSSDYLVDCTTVILHNCSKELNYYESPVLCRRRTGANYACSVTGRILYF
jgi:hypothetical protein